MKALSILSILVGVILISSTNYAYSSCFSSIISFGDSLTDTGNKLHLALSSAANSPPHYGKPPYGVSFFQNPTGRCSDGRLVIDFIDPDAEVVSLSPKTLLESDQYVCEICNQGFQRDQNLQMHRRRHKVPWKLLKRESPEVRKRVFVCPEPSCLHHDPCHALGDLVGIKKHFRRKHSNNKQWV